MKKQAILILLIVIFTSCEDQVHMEEESNEIFYSANTYNGYLFDMGSWFGVPIHDEGVPGIGPLLILSDSNGYILREKLLDIDFFSDGVEMPMTSETDALPGLVFQVSEGEGLSIYIKYAFIDHQTLIIRYDIKRDLQKNNQIEPRFVFAKNYNQNESVLEYDLGNAVLNIETFDLYDQLEGDKWRHDSAYSTISGFLAVRHRFKEDPDFQELVPDSLEDMLSRSIARWKSYFRNFSSLDNTPARLASKCIQTLVANWRSPAGELIHAGLFPSYAYRGFHGFWAWDSWKHAVALALFEPELAKEQIRAMFDFQNEYGMIADCIFRDTLIEKHNWRDTKPPLAAWAVKQVFNETGDTSFIKEMFPKLIKYHEWWYVNRDQNNNGLCEYGSTDGTRVAAAWESGMDNAVRFDKATLVQNNEHAWSLTQESVDLNAYLYAEKQFLMEMAEILGNRDIAEKFSKESVWLKEKIQEKFYDDESGYFYDISTTDGSRIKVIGPEAWITLWSGVADSMQAANVIEKIMDTLHFNTYLPFPTLSASHPEFNPQKGYWRGPVWLDQAYFALDGIRKYGYENEFHAMKTKLMANAEGLLGSDTPIRENYHPVSGKGLNAKHFSWSAAHLLLLLNETYD